MDLRDAVRLFEQGRHAEAESACRKALEENPADARFSHLLGRIALQSARYDEAVRCIGRAVALFPAALHYRMDLAAALAMSGRAAEALPHIAEALRERPGVPELHNNLGGVLEAVGRLSDAARSYAEAIRLRPGYAEAHYNLGNARRKMGRLPEAVEAYRESLRLQPNYVKALNNLATGLADLGDLDSTVATYRRLIEVAPDDPMPGSALLYALHYGADYDAAALYREHVEWARRHAEPVYRKHGRPHDNDRTPGRQLKVGYVSPDFREHTVPKFIGAALERHDRERFDIFLCSDVAEPDAVTNRLRGLGHEWRDTRKLSDAELDERVRADRIDILVDLRGHAAGNRMTLFARKPAPVQVTMVGTFNTTGLPTMDWRLTDEAMDPVGATEQYHTEKLARLPHTCWCYRPDDDAPDVAEPPAVTTGHVTFGSFNKLVKISPPCARLWARVLEAVPSSRLLLAVPSPDAADFVRPRLAGLGLPAGRLDFAPPERDRRAYLARFARIDVALTPSPSTASPRPATACGWASRPSASPGGRASPAPAAASSGRRAWPTWRRTRRTSSSGPPRRWRATSAACATCASQCASDCSHPNCSTTPASPATSNGHTNRCGRLIARRTANRLARGPRGGGDAARREPGVNVTGVVGAPTAGSECDCFARAAARSRAVTFRPGPSLVDP